MHKQVPKTHLSLLHLAVAASAVILRSSPSQCLPSSNMNWGGHSPQVQVWTQSAVSFYQRQKNTGWVPVWALWLPGGLGRMPLPLRPFVFSSMKWRVLVLPPPTVICSIFSRVWLFATLWTEACQAPLSLGFLRQEYWSGLPFPSPGGLPEPGIKPGSPAWQMDSLSTEPPHGYVEE